VCIIFRKNPKFNLLIKARASLFLWLDFSISYLHVSYEHGSKLQSAIVYSGHNIKVLEVFAMISQLQLQPHFLSFFLNSNLEP